MTAKTLRKKGETDCTRGLSREQRAINRRNKVESSLALLNAPKSFGGNKKDWNRFLKSMIAREEAEKAFRNFVKNQRAIAVERFGKHRFRDREVSNTVFEEKSFGNLVKPGQSTSQISATWATDLSSIVVSLALFDGDKMLFACSGIPLLYGTARQPLTRFVTSAHLVREFEGNRNRDDNLRIAVRLPDNTTTDGFLGLHDNTVAIVMCLGELLQVNPIDLDLDAIPALPGDYVLAAGRAFKSGSLMAMDAPLCTKHRNTWVPNSQDISKAVLGGPLLGIDGRLLGMNFDIHDYGDGTVGYAFLPLDMLRKCLKRFKILNCKKLHFRGYSLPHGVYSVIPSGFMETVCVLESYGYPLPPPLVLELNGKLLHRFEERFGEILAWKGFPYGSVSCGARSMSGINFQKKLYQIYSVVLSHLLHSMVLCVGFVRSFACTGFLIKWYGSKATSNVILTSASLVRDRYDENNIDNNLTIEVFLPPNQRGSGTLEFYNLNYNIAIVSLKKNFNAVRPDDIFDENAQKSSKKVVAIGRDPKHGLLMAASGEVKHGRRGCKLDCTDVQLSTCKIKKAGIGGPLINYDGSFVGMNFYDGSGGTPFLPRHKIVEVLGGVSALPSESGYNHPVAVDVGGGTTMGTQKNRWPVPQPYWYHGELDVYMYELPEHKGRRLD